MKGKNSDREVEEGMRNKKLFKSVVMFTTVMLLVSGCGKQEEPVSTEPTETVSEVEPEESTEEISEPSPTVEETEEPVESTEVEETSESEADTTEEEESTEENEETGIEIVEELNIDMFVQTSCNARSGDSTDFDVLTTFSTNTQVHVTGRTSNDWYRVEQSDGDVYVSGKLLGMDKVVVQQSSGGGSGSSGNGGGGSQSSGDTGGDSTDSEAISNMFSNMGLEQAGGYDPNAGSGLNWTTD